MMRMQRIFVTVSVLGVLLCLSAGLGWSQDRPSEKTFTISGSVGVAGVRMQGLPGEPVSDDSGLYSVQVPPSWTGRVIPMKEGYTFTPPARQYLPAKRDYTNEDYQASLLTFTVSGNTGVAGVVMKGLPGDPITDTRGYYTAKLEYGWTGTVTPVKEGHVFEPAQQVYRAVTRSYADQDYKTQVITYTLSGKVPIGGVEMQGLPGYVVTDRDGSYHAEVPYGWSGRVVPTKRGCEFAPGERRYTRVRGDVPDQDYDIVSLRAVRPPSYTGASSDVLVILTSEVDPKVVVQIEEDLQVMLEVLREQLRAPGRISGGLIDYGDFFGSGQSAEALYVGDYGALFVMKADFPFSFFPEEPIDEEPGQAVDPVWQRAREKLYTPPGGRGYGRSGTWPKAEGMSFEAFTEDLVRALRHATNIRHVTSDKAIVLTVIAQDQGGASYYGYRGGGSAYGGEYGGRSRSVSGSSFGPGGGSTYSRSEVRSRGTSRRESQTPVSDGQGNVKRDAFGNVMSYTRPATAPTVLTMRTTKAHVDAFAAGEIDWEAFRSQVKIFSY